MLGDLCAIFGDVSVPFGEKFTQILRSTVNCIICLLIVELYEFIMNYVNPHQRSDLWSPFP